MKKIVRVKKALQGLAMTLALATTISGCSFDNKVELNNDNSIAYESIQEETLESTTENHKHETKENETVDNKDEQTHEHVHESTLKDDSVSEPTKDLEENKAEVETKKEVKHNYTQDSFIVMYEGQELIVPNLSMQYNNQEYVKNSIIKALKLAGFDSGYPYRKTLAGFYEIENYKGTAEQNIKLLDYLRHPELYLNMDLVIIPSEKVENTGVTTENNNGVVNPDTSGNGNNGNENRDDDHKGDDDHGKDDKKKHKHSLKTTVTYEQLENNQHRKVTTVTCRGYIDGKPCTFKKVTYGKAENCKFDKDSLKCVCGRVHEHTYGDEVITYVDTEGSTHTIVVSKDCTYGDDHVEVSRTKAPHKFENYVVNAGTNTETGTCECGKTDTREITIEHEHVLKTEITYEQLENNKHRKVTTYTCTGLINGKPCTYKKVEYGEPENCKFDESTLKCKCGRVHVHDWKWVKVDNDNCQQVCTYDEKHKGKPSPHISDSTGIPTIVPNSGTAAGHKTQQDAHCKNCKENYTIVSFVDGHGNEHITVTTSYKQETRDGVDGHIKTVTSTYDDCGYVDKKVGEFTECKEKENGKCECGREIQCEHKNTVWQWKDNENEQEYCNDCKKFTGKTRRHSNVDSKETNEYINDDKGHRHVIKNHCDSCNSDLADTYSEPYTLTRTGETPEQIEGDTKHHKLRVNEKCPKEGCTYTKSDYKKDADGNDMLVDCVATNGDKCACGNTVEKKHECVFGPDDIKTKKVSPLTPNGKCKQTKKKCAAGSECTNGYADWVELEPTDHKWGDPKPNQEGYYECTCVECGVMYKVYYEDGIFEYYDANDNPIDNPQPNNPNLPGVQGASVVSEDAEDENTEDKNVPEEGNHQDGEQIPEDVQPENGEQTPEEGQPQEGEQTPEEGQPQEGEQTPEEGQPQEGEQTPEEGQPQEGEQTPEEGQPQEGERTPEERQPQEGEQAPEEGQPQEGEQTLEEEQPQEGEQQVQITEQGEGDEKSEEQHVSKDETDLYTAYNEAVTAFLSQYAKDKDYYERPYARILGKRC